MCHVPCVPSRSRRGGWGVHMPRRRRPSSAGAVTWARAQQSVVAVGRPVPTPPHAQQTEPAKAGAESARHRPFPCPPGAREGGRGWSGVAGPRPPFVSPPPPPKQWHIAGARTAPAGPPRPTCRGLHSDPQRRARGRGGGGGALDSTAGRPTSWGDPPKPVRLCVGPLPGGGGGRPPTCRRPIAPPIPPPPPPNGDMWCAGQSEHAHVGTPKAPAVVP